MKEKITNNFKRIFKIKWIMAVLTLISILLPMAVNAAETRYPTAHIKGGEWISNIWINKVRPNGRTFYQQAEFIRRSEDWQFVYCIQPTIPLGNDIYQGSYEDQAVVANMTQAKWNHVVLIAYYGYQYTDATHNHSDNKWYAISQLMIWQEVTRGLGWDIYFTDSLNGTKLPNKFTAEIAEIEALIANHYKSPSFDNAGYRIPIGSTIILNDTNNILNEYNVQTNGNLSAVKNGSTLSIKGDKIGKTTLNLTKTDTRFDIPPVVYVSADLQDVMARGSWDPIFAKLNIEVYGGTVELEKVDLDTGLKQPQGTEATLIGAKYELRAFEDIFDNDGNILIAKNTLVDTLITTDTSVKSKELPLGKYKLKEIESSHGYELDTQEYIIELTEDNLNVKFTVKEEVVKAKFEISKSYSQIETGQLISEEGILFDIYNNKNDLVSSITTDKFGHAEIVLPFGHYTFKQSNSLPTHEKVEDFNVVVDYETDDIVYYNLVNKIYEARIKIIKVDEETGNVIKSGTISYKIKNVDTGEYVKQKLLFPNPITIDTFVSKNGELVTPLTLYAGNYKIEEIKIEGLTGYYLNTDGIYFTIDENSDFIDDEIYEKIIEIKFSNNLVKGELQVNKIGEEIIYENASYYYDKIPLKDVKFKLYADEDIVSINGILRYKKGDLVTELTTDENAFAKVSNLWLGRYCLVEISNNNNNLVDSTPTCFTLEYKDQNTKVVFKTLNIENRLPKGSLEITKIDISDGKPIPNTKIDIYMETENGYVLIFSDRTDENGKIVINDLLTGKKYYFSESEAALGYVLNDEKHYFEILKDGEIIKDTLENVKVEMPKTFNTDIISFCIIIGTALAGVGVLIYEKNKKK